MVVLSTLIAAFGLVMGSAAVVIGAMLVAPLMTPILGLALALVRGELSFVGLAVRAEIAGVVLAVAAGFLIGLSLSPFVPSAEMLARTSPTLLDLLVAVFSGLAGAYALVNSRLSPALPGVAISTAIVPPLANTGLALALGNEVWAWGSFLLFFSNFLSIQLAAALVFTLAGFGQAVPNRLGVRLVGRFGVSLLGFVVVAVLLGSELTRVLERERLETELRDELIDALPDLGASALRRVAFRERDDTLLVLAELDAPRVVQPERTSSVEGRLAERVQRDVRLNLRVTLTKNVSASGHFDDVFAASMEEFNLGFTETHPRRRIQRVEQLVREHLDRKLGVRLDDVRVLPFGDSHIVILDVSGSRHLSRDEIATLDRALNEQFDPKRIELKVVQNTSSVRDAKGVFRSEFSMRRPPTEAERTLSERAETAALQWLSERRFWLDGWSFDQIGERYHMLLEVKGPRLLTQADLDALTEIVSRAAGEPMKLVVRSQPEVVLGDEEGISFEMLLQRYRTETRAAYDDATRRLIDSVR